MSDIYRATVTLVQAGQTPEVQAEALGRTVDAEHWQPYGLATSPPAGTDALVASVAGSADNPAAVCVSDRAERPTDLAPNDVALWSRHGHDVRLSTNGIDLGAGGAAIGRVGDAVQVDLGAPANAAWLGWFQAVAAATVPLPPALILYGTITAGSAIVRAE